jgi:hypothetical protein
VKSVSLKALMQSRRPLMPPIMPWPERLSRTPSDSFAPAGCPVERRRQVEEELRTVGARAFARMSSNASSGRPPGLPGDFSMSGVTAPISTAFATRFVPWRPR